MSKRGQILLALKSLVKRSVLGRPLARVSRWFRERVELVLWTARGRPVPPPYSVKRGVVESYGRSFSLKVMIESGTYTGEMVEAGRRRFRRIFSIELDEALAERARQRFSGLDHISILQGDSRDVLPSVLAAISEPALFWLDAHYSGGITSGRETSSPVLKELAAVLNHPVAGHVVLIDDARGFTGPDAYPKLEDLRRLVAWHKPDWCFDVRDDIIRVHELRGHRL